ncbi:SAF domain-containing protein [Catellatospora sp. KI3]|uniref:SAF domain-containing protein n=1 Tax=Catellatospora sp. KI3 TaxID=3041620 RepID=UPI002482E141|nr:SAF domain-containing protein [Catellatospora sp. KI3]MDI1462094.1 SAF domain-containing protein [Catellatospora sp. KI3]
MSITTTNVPARAPLPPIGVARSAPRRRSWAQASLAVLLIVLGALTAGYVVLRMGSTHDFLAVGRPIGAGAEITAADLVIVRVNDAAGLKPVPAGQAANVVGKRTLMALVPGSLITMDQITDTPVPAPGMDLVGIALDEDRMPTLSRIPVGASVLLVLKPEVRPAVDGGAPELVPPRTIAARIIDRVAGTKVGQTLLNVEVATADAPTVALYAADKRLVLTLDGP